MIATEKCQDSTIIKPEGKITAANVDVFRQDLLELVESGEVNLTIDLEKVEMIDSKGLAVFIICHKTVTDKGGELIVVCDNPDMLNLFHAMRLDEHFTVKESG